MTVEFSRNVYRTKNNFYCKNCSYGHHNTVVFDVRHGKAVDMLTTNNNKLYCGVCDAYIGRIIQEVNTNA